MENPDQKSTKLEDLIIILVFVIPFSLMGMWALYNDFSDEPVQDSCEITCEDSPQQHRDD